jgi:hypothetical protein
MSIKIKKEDLKNLDYRKWDIYTKVLYANKKIFWLLIPFYIAVLLIFLLVDYALITVFSSLSSILFINFNVFLFSIIFITYVYFFYFTYIIFIRVIKFFIVLIWYLRQEKNKLSSKIIDKFLSQNDRRLHSIIPFSKSIDIALSDFFNIFKGSTVFNVLDECRETITKELPILLYFSSDNKKVSELNSLLKTISKSLLSKRFDKISFINSIKTIKKMFNSFKGENVGLVPKFKPSFDTKKFFSKNFSIIIGLIIFAIIGLPILPNILSGKPPTEFMITATPPFIEILWKQVEMPSQPQVNQPQSLLPQQVISIDSIKTRQEIYYSGDIAYVDFNITNHLRIPYNMTVDWIYNNSIVYSGFSKEVNNTTEIDNWQSWYTVKEVGEWNSHIIIKYNISNETISKDAITNFRVLK